MKRRGEDARLQYSDEMFPNVNAFGIGINTIENPYESMQLVDCVYTLSYNPEGSDSS